MQMNNEENPAVQAMVTNIKWSSTPAKKYKVSTKASDQELPEQYTLDVPINVVSNAKSKTAYYNAVETYVYNLLTNKFNYEVNRCQIWLPLED